MSDNQTSAALDQALDVLRRTQAYDGSWVGNYSGPLFLLPMYVGTAYVLGLQLDEPTRDGMISYLRRHQNADGGYGLHVEGPSCVFTSVLNYVALRMLGVDKNDAALTRCREWFLPRGGPLGSAPWGKFFLGVINLHDYRGLHPVLPELWRLPKWFPLHPRRLWCHARMVYLPMAYLYGTESNCELTPLLSELRDEIYAEPYDGISWASTRDTISETDVYRPHTWPLKAAHRLLGAYARRPRQEWRRRALDSVLSAIAFEDRSTQFICIGPVNKLLNTLVWHFARPGEAEVARHMETLPLYLSRDEQGVRTNGYNSSQLWDTAFAAQAIAAAGVTEHNRPMLMAAGRFIGAQQVLEESPEAASNDRDPSIGGWPFSNLAHGWPITDCTAEGLKAALSLERHAGLTDQPVSVDRMVLARDRILGWQNPDGGWPTYERVRGGKWLEAFNPSQIFGDIMIDASCVECTSACVQALAMFAATHAEMDHSRSQQAIRRGQQFLLTQQRADGSWEGSWGVCFTYGTWFGVWGLLAAGMEPHAPAIRRACEFLASKQLPDGGWGELLEGCRRREYVSSRNGQPVQTSWAALTLLAARRHDDRSVQAGLRFLESTQRPDGSWPAQPICGVFNRTCGIHYDNYLKIFPLWALALGRLN